MAKVATTSQSETPTSESINMVRLRASANTCGATETSTQVSFTMDRKMAKVTGKRTETTTVINIKASTKMIRSMVTESLLGNQEVNIKVTIKVNVRA